MKPTRSGFKSQLYHLTPDQAPFLSSDLRLAHIENEGNK